MSKIEEIGEFIQSHSKILSFGGKTKTSLRLPPETAFLDVSEIAGVIDYDPSEFTFTAYAGTRIEDINQMLSENGQFLPFDPPMRQQGATLGGTVAANLNGPGRYRYGGVRDFILGVKYFDDLARMIRSGGKVVKNAAGFDIPKLMVGSLGEFGAMIELSFKVFPKPIEYTTIIAYHQSIVDAIDTLIRVSSSSIEIFCLDIEPDKNSTALSIRLGGKRKLLPNRIDRLKVYFDDYEILDHDDELNYWENVREFNWLPSDATLVKIPITPGITPQLDRFLAEMKVLRRYSVGANLAWVAWSRPFEILDQFLKKLNLSGLSLIGSPDHIRLGNWERGIFEQHLKNALDPSGKWLRL